MSATIRVSIDRRTDLGNHYSLAERSGRTIILNDTHCEVREDCGAIIKAGESARIWHLRRISDSGTTVGLLCNRCDAELVEVADDEVNA